MTQTQNQTFLFDAYQIGDGDFTDIACLDCARKFAEERGLEWDGAHKDTFTKWDDANGAYANYIHSSEGETDYPYSCCDTYLHTNLTEEGVNYLKENFPAWVVALYGY